MGASEDSEQEKSEGSKQLTTRLWLSGRGGGGGGGVNIIHIER